jgi:hypothetical protein
MAPGERMFGAHMPHAAYNHNPIQGVKKTLLGYAPWLGQ